MISLRNFFITFLIALLVFGVCAYYVTGFVVDSVQGLMVGDNVPAETTNNQEESDKKDDEYIPTYYNDIEGESFNILLVGTDYRPSLYKDYAPGTESEYPFFENSEKLIGDGNSLPEYPYRTVSADAIALVCVNKNTHAVAVVNIPSDMVITFPTDETTKLGDLYYELGFKEFKNKIADLTGADIDYYAIASIEQIVNVVDKVGPVTFDVPCDMQYTDEANGLSISISRGRKSINGEMAAGLLAFESYTVSGLSRAKTMFDFLEVLAKKVADPTNRLKAATIFGNVSSYVKTDATADDVVGNLDVILGISGFEFIKVDYPHTITNRPNVEKAIDTIAQYTDKN